MPQPHYREYGEPKPGQPPLIFLHGLFGSSANWGSIARGLSQHYHVLVPDARNHGKSFHDDDVSYPALAADLLGLMDARGIGQAILVGHSMGGKTAMLFALEHPQRVKSLAVVDMSPVRYPLLSQALFAGFDAVDLVNLTGRSEADQSMAQHIKPPGIRAFLLQNLLKESAGWRWKLNLPAIRDGLVDIAAFPAAPGAFYAGVVDFIYGTASDYLQESYYQEIRALFPKARFCPVENAGHWVYADQPQGFERCLQNFLAAE